MLDLTPTPAVIGIDPGLTGGIAVLDMSGQLLELHPMPVEAKPYGGKVGKWVDAWALASLLWPWTDRAQACVEYVGAMSRGGRQGVTTTASLADSMATVRGALACCHIPTEFVRPADWKKRLGLTHREKGASRLLASQYWGNGHFSRADSDGLAEAALIARYRLKAVTAAPQ